jgi:hypothetical protein
MKDTYVSPALGLKYSHEKLMERYKHEVLSAKNERHREVIEKFKEKAKPMDHEELHRRRLEYSANLMQKQEERDSRMHKQVAARNQLYDFNHSDYMPAKSRAYLRVVENKEFGKTPEMEKLERARKAIDTRKHYSEIVKDIFFKDALLNNKSGLKEVPKQITSLRDIKEEAEKRRKDEYEHHKLMHELGQKYLEDVRRQNMNVTPQTRKVMDEKRFAQMRSVDKPKKSRKYLDQVARDFKDPREVVVQKDLMKKLKPTTNSDSHNAFVHNVKYFDERLVDQEIKVKYKAGKQDLGLELGDKYINSIQSKLNVLEKETIVGKKDAKKDPLESANPSKDDGSKSGVKPDGKPKDPTAPKTDPKPADPKAPTTNQPPKQGDAKDTKDPKAPDAKPNPQPAPPK